MLLNRLNGKYVKNKLFQGQLKMIILMQCIKWLIITRNCNNKLMWYTDEFLLVSASLTEKRRKKKSFLPSKIIAAVIFLHFKMYQVCRAVLYIIICSGCIPIYCVSPNKIAIEMLPISYIFIQLHDIWTLCNLYRNRRKRYVRQGYPKRCKIDA